MVGAWFGAICIAFSAKNEATVEDPQETSKTKNSQKEKAS